jgi:hypothetical protein
MKGTTNDTYEQTERLLNELAKIGETSFNEEYRNSISKWEKIGMALAHYTDNVPGIYEMANAAATDWNYHRLVAVVDFILSYNTPKRQYMLEYLKSALEGEHWIMSDPEWRDGKLTEGGETRKVKITINIEELD